MVVHSTDEADEADEPQGSEAGPTSVVGARDVFESHRRYLLGVAYRMMGTLADAEDVVQDAWLRWERVQVRADADAVERPRAYLAQVVTRLCLDALKSARAQRERYVGPWLPEPIVGTAGAALLSTPAPSADAAAELAEDVSMALMVALERLSPLERAAFLLREVFDAEYAEIASTLQRSESACRQLASRAKKTVASARPRFRPTRDQHARLVMAFGAAAATQDADQLASLLAEDVVFYSDGGGQVRAALRPIHGPDNVTRFILGLLRKFPMQPGDELVLTDVNGAPGFVRRLQGEVDQAIAFDIRDGRIQAIYGVRNPDKLTRVEA